MIKVIYAFFVGLLLAIFVGVGVSAFYPAPKAPQYPSSLATPEKAAPSEQTDAQLDAQREYEREYEVFRAQDASYNRNVSIIVLVAAVIFVVVSLLFESKIRIIADGILLGGVFSLVYSIGRSFQADDSKYTFLVVAVGLVIALFMGYLRFIKPQERPAEPLKPAAKKAGKRA